MAICACDTNSRSLLASDVDDDDDDDDYEDYDDEDDDDEEADRLSVISEPPDINSLNVAVKHIDRTHSEGASPCSTPSDEVSLLCDVTSYVICCHGSRDTLRTWLHRLPRVIIPLYHYARGSSDYLVSLFRCIITHVAPAITSCHYSAVSLRTWLQRLPRVIIPLYHYARGSSDYLVSLFRCIITHVAPAITSCHYSAVSLRTWLQRLPRVIIPLYHYSAASWQVVGRSVCKIDGLRFKLKVCIILNVLVFASLIYCVKSNNWI